MRQFGRFLDVKKIPAPGSIEVISRAKVPIIKYVDGLTGLKVDISFENDTGIIANKTFQMWKKKYPAMPILVTLIKHFLAMRGLNEPSNGGIGGFTVICLVVSLLQTMPQIQSGDMIPEHHLGEVLMEFFDLYGNELNVETTGIQFDPPGYFQKASHLPVTIPLVHADTSKQSRNHNLVYRGNSRLKFSIIDPNTPTNDIAGGSTNTRTILKCFSEAYDDLHARMAKLSRCSHEERKNQSLLGVIIAGNYSSFAQQRQHLKDIYSKRQPFQSSFATTPALVHIPRRRRYPSLSSFAPAPASGPQYIPRGPRNQTFSSLATGLPVPSVHQTVQAQHIVEAPGFYFPQINNSISINPAPRPNIASHQIPRHRPSRDVSRPLSGEQPPPHPPVKDTPKAHWRGYN